MLSLPAFRFSQNVATSGASGRMAPRPTTAIARSSGNVMCGLLGCFLRGLARVERVGHGVEVGDQARLRPLDLGEAQRGGELRGVLRGLAGADQPLQAAG